MQQALTVKQLNFYVKSLLEGDTRLLSCCVRGEISNFKRHISSGHIYFTLGDGFSSIKCVMFKGNALRCNLELKDGIAVNCFGRVSLYEKDGTYQLYVESITPDGIGDKLLALQLLKEKLLKEGLFDDKNKRPLVKFPKRIAVVTSGTGAALQDIINVISRRFPVCEVVVCSAGVQGEGAAGEMIAVLERIYDISDAFDTIIIGRGGGSTEDLSAFNDEALARKIYASPIPVISAVGHQTDTTICDLVADLRAPTPSAAAELAVPDYNELLNMVAILKKSAATLLGQKYEIADARLNALLSKSVISNPLRFIEDSAVALDTIFDKIVDKTELMLQQKNTELNKVISVIDAMSPLKVMLRGYSVATISGKAVRSVNELKVNDKISLRLSDGSVDCTVTNK